MNVRTCATHAAVAALVLVSLAAAGCTKTGEVQGVPPGGAGGSSKSDWPIAAQFDGGGALDLVNAYDKTLVALYGGESEPAWSSWTYSREQPLAFKIGAGAGGDLDGDGKTDLVVTDKDGDKATVLLHTGDGKSAVDPFTAQSATLDCGKGPHLVAIGRLDDDDALDLAIYSEADKRISVFRGKGDGSFDPLLKIESVPASGRSLTIGYFARLDETKADTVGDILFGHRKLVATNPTQRAVVRVYRGKDSTWSLQPDVLDDSPIDKDIGDVRPGKGLPTDGPSELHQIVIFGDDGSAKAWRPDWKGVFTPAPLSGDATPTY